MQRTGSCGAAAVFDQQGAEGQQLSPHQRCSIIDRSIHSALQLAATCAQPTDVQWREVTKYIYSIT